MSEHHNLINSLSPPMRNHQSAFTTAATENNSGCGEIVEVEGGHIVRSIGKKDRHSKVCTAKGPRDRRVRLSAPTAIQFYDVQDRLGFDRPSKAVDWLIKKAKSSIDDLAQLPPWNPADTLRQHKTRKTKTLISPPPQHEEEELNLPFSVGTSFLPASMDSDSISDTIKSFFPVASTQQNYHHHNHHQPSLQSNTQNQDLLRLSLQSFQNGSSFGNQTESGLFSGQSNTPLVFESSSTSWDQNHQSSEFGKIQRLVTWNNGGATDSTGTGGGGGGGGFVFASSSPPSSFQPVYNQSQLFSQRGPLQSINTPMLRAWCDPHHPHHHQHQHHQHQAITTDDLHHHHPYNVPSSIHQPARFHGMQEDHVDNTNKQSSDSRH